MFFIFFFLLRKLHPPAKVFLVPLTGESTSPRIFSLKLLFIFMLDNKTLNSGRITTITIYGYNNNHYNLQITRSMLVMFKITI